MSEVDPQNPGQHPPQKESGHPLVIFLSKAYQKKIYRRLKISGQLSFLS